MRKIAILSCQLIRSQNLCPADTKCLTALMRREGWFDRYKDEEAHLLGIIDCGGCTGDRVVCALTLLKMQLDALKENIDELFIATCIMNFCPYRDEIIATAKEKSGVEVIVGTHKYALPQIFKG